MALTLFIDVSSVIVSVVLRTLYLWFFFWSHKTSALFDVKLFKYHCVKAGEMKSCQYPYPKSSDSQSSAVGHNRNSAVSLGFSDRFKSVSCVALMVELKRCMVTCDGSNYKFCICLQFLDSYTKWLSFKDQPDQKF